MSTARLEMNPRTRKTCERVMQAVRYCGYTEQVSGRELERIIITVHGYDPRTVARIRQLLVIGRYIAPVNQYVFQIMPEGQTALDEYDVGPVEVEHVTAEKPSG